MNEIAPKLTLLLLLSLALLSLSSWSSDMAPARATAPPLLRLGPRQPQRQRQRRTQRPSPYHTLTSSTLGEANPDAAVGNPLKGLIECPQYNPPPYKVTIPFSMEFYYLNLDDLMIGNPNVVGNAAAFHWTTVDRALSGSASRNMHAVMRVILHFPNSKRPLRVPQYLINGTGDGNSKIIELRSYTNGTSPYYGDAILLEALQQFITAFAQRYDTDKRLAYLQAGLLGFWGEWHTFPHTRDFLPDTVKDSAVNWFETAFLETRVQYRFPRPSIFATATDKKTMGGLHDDSFAFQTLDGIYSNFTAPSYFWPSVVRAGGADFWKRAPMGGETYPPLQKEVFQDAYPARTFQKQSFMDCVQVTHATYILHHGAFRNGGYAVDSGAYRNAMFATARMGYNFVVSKVEARPSMTSSSQRNVGANNTATLVDIDVTVTQIGVAPFYFDLALALDCSGWNKQRQGGVEKIIEEGTSQTFSFVGLPSTKTCLDALTVTLESSYAYAGRPIKFAQGNGAVVFSVPPLPPSGGGEPAPTMPDAPRPSPIQSPPVPTVPSGVLTPTLFVPPPSPIVVLAPSPVTRPSPATTPDAPRPSPLATPVIVPTPTGFVPPPIPIVAAPSPVTPSSPTSIGAPSPIVAATPTLPTSTTSPVGQTNVPPSTQSRPKRPLRSVLVWLIKWLKPSKKK